MLPSCRVPKISIFVGPWPSLPHPAFFISAAAVTPQGGWASERERGWRAARGEDGCGSKGNRGGSCARGGLAPSGVFGDDAPRLSTTDLTVRRIHARRFRCHCPRALPLCVGRRDGGGDESGALEPQEAPAAGARPLHPVAPGAPQLVHLCRCTDLQGETTGLGRTFAQAEG